MARARAMALLCLAVACGGKVEARPDGGASAGGGGAPSADASTGSGGTMEEPWDAMVDGAPATPEQLCGMGGIPVPDPCSQAEMSSRLCRRWWQCSGEFVFGTPDAVGVEFTPDGQWHLLTLDPTGAVVAATGADAQGKWDMYGPGPMNGPCSIQVDIYKGGMIGAFPMFYEQPTKVNLNTGGDGGKPVYVAIP